MPTKTDPAHVASDLRIVLAQLTRRLRRENRLPLVPCFGPWTARTVWTKSVSDLAAAERVRPQSMAQTVMISRPTGRDAST